MRKIAFIVSLVLFTLPAFAAPETVAPATTAPAAPEMTAPATAAPATPARLSCETLKARVDAKLQAKGVPSYSLEIVPVEGASSGAESASGVAATPANKGKEVGTCDGGTKRLMYTRGN